MRRPSRTFLITLTTIAAAFIGVMTLADDTYAGKTQLLPDEIDDQAVAVVELYTSEGCSSCPPADALLDALGREAAQKRAPVYPLAFHVDYWNYIGWRDPYSSEAWSRRQRQFAASIGSTRIYTPQMIVNGQRELVGSSTGRAKEALRDALGSSASAKIDIRQLTREGRKISARYQISGAPDRARVLLAITEGGLTSQIDAGENHGRTLTHAHVVRALSMSRDAGGVLEAVLPEGVDYGPLTAVLYVQSPDGWRVLGASAKGL